MISMMNYFCYSRVDFNLWWKFWTFWANINNFVITKNYSLVGLIKGTGEFLTRKVTLNTWGHNGFISAKKKLKKKRNQQNIWVEWLTEDSVHCILNVKNTTFEREMSDFKSSISCSKVVFFAKKLLNGNILKRNLPKNEAEFNQPHTIGGSNFMKISCNTPKVINYVQKWRHNV